MSAKNRIHFKAWLPAAIVLILLIFIASSVWLASREESTETETPQPAELLETPESATSQAVAETENNRDEETEPIATPEEDIVPDTPVTEPVQPLVPELTDPNDSDPTPAPTPALPVEEEYLTFTGNEFNQLFNEAELPNLTLSTEPPSITGDNAVDERIRRITVERGYRRRPLPADTSLLVLAEGQYHYLQPEATRAYKELKAGAAADGLIIWLVSGYRNHDSQRSGFLRELPATRTDAEIFERLKLVATPGYSKHHTGYTIDLGQGSEFVFDKFAESASYAWLSADNFKNAKKYGWIPSYPEDATNQGPDPEAWEFTYVGKQRLLKQ